MASLAAGLISVPPCDRHANLPHALLRPFSRSLSPGSAPSLSLFPCVSEGVTPPLQPSHSTHAPCGCASANITGSSCPGQ